MLAVNCHEMIYNIVSSGVWNDSGGFESRVSTRNASIEYRGWSISSVGRLTSDGMALNRRYTTEVVFNGPVFKPNTSNDVPCILTVS